VIIEGGSATLQYFIDNHLWDEARVFVAPATFEKGLRAPIIHGNLKTSTAIAADQLLVYTPIHHAS
jgi:diaminohydroxyphosphoribosylaminopyrimidine deaminase/5-amino-6-(5-phosphoribosylamino)uracil reductase